MDLLKSVKIKDDRGSLQIWDNLPFDVKRVFTITDVGKNVVRGDHAHRTCEQFLICLTGYVNFTIIQLDGTREFFKLCEGWAFHLPPQHWIEMYDWSANANLLVLCSEPYRKEDVITDFEEFSRMGR